MHDVETTGNQAEPRKVVTENESYHIPKRVCVEPAWETIKATLVVSSLLVLAIIAALLFDYSPQDRRTNNTPSNEPPAIAVEGRAERPPVPEADRTPSAHVEEAGF